MNRAELVGLVFAELTKEFGDPVNMVAHAEGGGLRFTLQRLELETWVNIGFVLNANWAPGETRMAIAQGVMDMRDISNTVECLAARKVHGVVKSTDGPSVTLVDGDDQQFFSVGCWVTFTECVAAGLCAQVVAVNRMDGRITFDRQMPRVSGGRMSVSLERRRVQTEGE